MDRVVDAGPSGDIHPVHLAIEQASDGARLSAATEGGSGFYATTGTKDLRRFASGAALDVSMKLGSNTCAALSARFGGTCEAGFVAAPGIEFVWDGGGASIIATGDGFDRVSVGVQASVVPGLRGLIRQRRRRSSAGPDPGRGVAIANT